MDEAEEKRIESAVTDFLFKKPSCSECKGFRETRCYVDREHFKKTGELSLSFEPCRTCVARAAPSY